MSSPMPSADGFVRRNLPPLIVGAAALVAIVGGLIVVVDRVRDDDDGDDETRVITVADGRAERPFAAFGGELDRLLDGLLDEGPALGVRVNEDDGRLVVDEVVPGSPAARAGIEVGDEIRELNGERVRSVEELREAVAGVLLGEEYEVELRRDGDERTLTVQREGLPADLLGALLRQFLAGGLELEGFNFENFNPENFDLERFLNELDLEGFDLERFVDEFDAEDFDLERFLEELGREEFDLGRFLEELDQGDFDLQRFLEGLDQGDLDLERFLREFRFEFDGRDPRFGAPFGFQQAPDPFGQFRLQPTFGVSVVQTTEGLKVLGVEPGSIAEQAGIERDDLILEVGGRPVRRIEELQSALPAFDGNRDRQASPPRLIEVRVRRGGLELGLLALFPAFPIQPQIEDLPLAPPPPDLRTEQLEEDLRALESFLTSDEFVELLGESLRERVEGFVAEALGGGVEDRAEPDDGSEESAFASEDLDVFRGTVATLSDGQITLDGSLGAITLTLSEETVFVGAPPRVGGISTVAADAEFRAVLVLTPN